MSRYDIGVCQRFSAEVHGIDLNTSSPGIENHYLCLIVLSSVSECDHVRFITDLTKGTMTPCSIEIIQTYILEPGSETVAIYKTFWLRILQKKVRRWLKLARTIRTNQIYRILMRREYTAARLTL
jgi:hypothetical protein